MSVDMKKLEEILKSCEDEMLQTAQEWIRIPSVKGEPAENAPFGQHTREALDSALSVCKKLGFEVDDVDGYAMHAEMGEGSEQDALAVLCHLDVVPVGDGWTMDPFCGTIADGKLYGRGACDDKGPAAAALYAMKAVKELGIPLKRRVRLILGVDEETGSADMEYYKKARIMPRQGFSPDAAYPVINIEKGRVALELTGENDQSGLKVLQFNVGERFNVIPGNASALVEGGEELIERVNRLSLDFPVGATAENGAVRLTTRGIPGHAAMPEGGRNAICQMLLVLKALGVKGALAELADQIGMTYYGEGLNIAMEDQISGKLTCSMGIIRVDEKKVYATLDLRCPVLCDLPSIPRLAQMELHHLTVHCASSHPAHHVPASSTLVRSLLSAYEETTGLKGEAIAIGGGTYAESLEEGVAFGAQFPDDAEMAHQADEYITVESLKKNMRIFANAIIKLAAE